LFQFLASLGFKVTQSDNSLSSKYENIDTTIVLFYVDDTIVTENNYEKNYQVKKYLKEKFKIKDFGKLKYYLGIKITHSTKELFISQRKYILDLLKKITKLGSKPTSTPIDSNCKLNTKEGEPIDDITQYQRLVEKLIYLMVTRSEISFAVNQVIKFMHAPRKPHLDVIDRILRYSKKSPENGM
jgi:Reverse transcriptase (RNA-dependent DNA polymerase)